MVRPRALLLATILALGAVGSVAGTGPTSIAHAQRAIDRPWLGIGMSPTRAPGGVDVSRVVRNSPAARAGLRVGDRVVSIDGVKTVFPSDVTRAVQAHAVAESLVVQIERDGKPLAATVLLAAMPSSDEMMRMDHVGGPMRPWAGVQGVHGAFPAGPAQLNGRVVVLEFWATWCGPCRITAPVLEGWQKRYGAQGLSVVGISSEELDTVAAHGASSNAHYPLGVDTDGQTTLAYGVSSLPTLFIVDRRGVVREVVVGYDPVRLAKVEGVVRALLAESAPVR